jgi:hypothetical protein
MAGFVDWNHSAARPSTMPPSLPPPSPSPRRPRRSATRECLGRCAADAPRPHGGLAAVGHERFLPKPSPDGSLAAGICPAGSPLSPGICPCRSRPRRPSVPIRRYSRSFNWSFLWWPSASPGILPATVSTPAAAGRGIGATSTRSAARPPICCASRRRCGGCGPMPSRCCDLLHCGRQPPSSR